MLDRDTVYSLLANLSEERQSMEHRDSDGKLLSVLIASQDDELRYGALDSAISGLVTLLLY
jgi:hypothetical protein